MVFCIVPIRCCAAPCCDRWCEYEGTENSGAGSRSHYPFSRKKNSARSDGESLKSSPEMDGGTLISVSTARRSTYRSSGRSAVFVEDSRFAHLLSKRSSFLASALKNDLGERDHND